MQGWLYGKGLIYLTGNISANKISLPLAGPRKANFVSQNIGR